jgi:transposase-like protein
MTAALVLEAELLAHLQLQLVSARRLLGLVLEQGAAIRDRDAEAVLHRLTRIQTEMGRRSALETERAGLLQRAGSTLGVPPSQVTLERLCELITPAGAQAAVERSAELRGLLAEIAREHGINRALMRQELAFLSHLTRLIGHEPEPGYRPPGTGTAPEAPAPPAGSAPRPRHIVNYQA